MSKALQTRPVAHEVTVTTAGLTAAHGRKAGSMVPADVAATIRDGQSVVASVGNGVMWDAAILTHYVKETDPAIGKAYAEAGTGWATQRDYAAAIGFGETYVSRLVLLGRAIVVHGVRAGSPDYTTLASHASKFSALIKGDDSKALREALAWFRKSGEGPATARREATPPTGTT
jgi:hypothetical protein